MPRVQNFIWRLCKDIIPTKINLQKKGCCSETLCPNCSSATESTSHLFLHCHFAKKVWFALPISIRIPENEDVFNWLEKRLGSPVADVDRIICITLWKIWRARNLVVFERKEVDPRGVAREVMDAVWELKVHEPVDKRVIDSEIEWNQSQEAFHSVFVDAGCFQNGAIVLGCVIKDSMKQVVLATTSKMESSASPEVAEALALRWGIQTAANLKLSRVVFHSDASSVVDCVNGSKVRAEIDPVIKDCNLFLRNFAVAAVVYVSRNFNADAHSLIRIGNVVGSKTWLGFIPNSDVIPVVADSN